LEECLSSVVWKIAKILRHGFEWRLAGDIRPFSSSTSDSVNSKQCLYSITTLNRSSTLLLVESIKSCRKDSALFSSRSIRSL
jgi:hypothetical protein